ncbi:MAG: hypothetical protein IJF49_07145 [Clostridia bacterium]|nr:hypothetical protein [Clostridia bacterium]
MKNRFHSRRIRLLALTLTLLSLAACGRDKTPPDQGQTPDNTTPMSAETTASPAIQTTLPPAAETTTAPMPETTAAPSVHPEPAASGSFSSDTGSNLEVHIDWSVISSDEKTVTLRAEAYITHYSIWVSARNNGTLKIGNSSQTFSTEAITYEGSAKQTKTLASATVDIPLAEDGTATVEISVSWPFWGSYSGIKIDHLTCGGEITVGKAKTPAQTTQMPETTIAPETTAAPVPADEPASITELGTPVLYRSRLFLDRTAAHFSSVTLVSSVSELSRLLGAHSDCTSTVCEEIENSLASYDDTYFREHALLLIPMGNQYSTAAPIEIFDIRSDDGALYVHIRDIAPTRGAEPKPTTRFYLLIAEIPADAIENRTICIAQHGVYYTDTGRYERDYLRDEGISSAPVVRAYQAAAITP